MFCHIVYLINNLFTYVCIKTADKATISVSFSCDWATYV